MIEDHELNGHGAFADGELTATVSGREGEALVHKLCADEAVSLDKALSLLAWFEENCAGAGAAVDWEALRALEARHRQAWHFLIAYQANQKTARDMQMATRVMALELGYNTAAGARDVAELARSTGFKKATVNKCALNFQAKLGLPPRPGQRSADACENMTAARRKQLKY